MESAPRADEPAPAIATPHARRRPRPSGLVSRSLALSLLLHAAAVGGLAAGGFRHGVHAADTFAMEIRVASAGAETAAEPAAAPQEPRWAPQVDSDEELPEVVAAPLPALIEPQPSEEPLAEVELDRGFEGLPLESFAGAQPPPVPRPELPPGGGADGGSPSAPSASGSPARSSPGEFVPKRLGALSETEVVGVRGEGGPVLIEGPEPQYPPIARRRGWEGSLVARIRVGADGLVEAASVEESSGYEVLDAAALEAIRKWRFEPGRREGKARAMEVLHRVRFRLVDEQDGAKER
jgi:protein TonB